MSESASNTDELLRMVRDGDQAAMNQLLQMHQARLLKMIERRIGSRLAVRVDPSDVLQETLLEAHRRLADYARDQPIPYFPWLWQIARKTLSHLHEKHVAAQKRSLGREEPLAPFLADDSMALLARRLLSTGAAPHRQAVRAEDRARVQQALEQLDETDRELIVLRYMDQLSIEEIGAVLGLGNSAVKMRHLRVLQRLRPLLEE